jgi:Recombination endonuclease VII
VSVTDAGALSAHGRCATHRHYKLSCSQYEELLALSGGGCQICAFPASEMPQGRLHIDHAGADWAVRGLLCISCNSQLGTYDCDWIPGRDFKARAWWKMRCAELGFPAGMRPEPEIGAVIRNQWGTVWIRTDAVWWHAPRQRGHGWSPMGWRQLYASYGPHNLVPLDITAETDDRDLRSIQWQVDNNPEYWMRDEVHRIAAGLPGSESAFAAGVLF